MTLHVVVGAGPVGADTARLLAESGDDVRVVTRRGTGPSHERIELVAADATTQLTPLTPLTSGAATLINCASPPYDRLPEETPALSAALLAAAEKSGAAYLNLPNTYGYGPVDGPQTDDLPMRPTTIKGRVRASMYLDGLAAHEAGLVRFAEVRPADFIGAGAVSMFTLLISAPALAGQDVVFAGDLDAPHSWSYTGDAARTLVAVARSSESWGRAWHAPSASDLSVRAIAARFADVAGVPARQVREMTALELHAAALADPIMAETTEMQYLYQRSTVLDWSGTAAMFDLKPTPLDDVLRELATAGR
jgi:nucleoside-diphosphate-sugar epimerase